MYILLACAAAIPSAIGAAAADARYTTPVSAVAPTLLDVPYNSGVAKFPVYISIDWTQPQPGITRAILIFHGLLRNADSYFAGGLKARDAAGSAGTHAMIIAPQFLADFDIPAHSLPSNTIGWHWDRWARGEPATRPAPLSGFDAVDAILSRLSDRTIFPNLNTVVIAGFSAGGQIVQRYAAVGRGSQVFPPTTAVKFVVSDPSSYLYFTPDRPDPSGRLARFANGSRCPGWNDWHYGLGGGVPPYVQATPAILEHRYAQRDVTYLLGLADTDPNHPVLDKSCAAEAEGPQRLARGRAYFAAMQVRDAAILNQHLIEVPGIAHEGNRMFNTDCGLHVLFGKPGCPEANRP